MKFVFPILAILVCGAAAYFSFTLSDKFQTTQKDRIQAIETNVRVEASIVQAEEEIIKEEDLLKKSQDNLALVNASVQSLESDATRLKNELGELDADLAILATKLEEQDKVLKEVQAMFAEMNLGDDVNEDNLAEKIGDIKDDIKVKSNERDILEKKVENAKKSLAAKQEDVSRLVARKDARDTRISRNAMEARVTAVNGDWGFLVIGAGENSGFTPQTTLLVQRDGRLIGKVNPSAIEPTQTIAEIDFKSISPGVRIQPGDSVILAKPAAN